MLRRSWRATRAPAHFGSFLDFATPALMCHEIRGRKGALKKFSLCDFFRSRHSQAISESDLSHVRNIGVIAHVDAGKTTTCERMLFYAGITNRIGDVDKGNTVLDYMQLEQERGITINAAAISFNWGQHRVNLIDTPGHVDFMFEVERSIRVLDGAVVIFDAVAGVQAQSETVWGQARRNSIPGIAYLNKMDREGASFENTVAMIANKLSVVPVPVQIPLFENGRFEGVVDLLTMESLHWGDHNGTHLIRKSIYDGRRGSEDPNRRRAERAREEMTEIIADGDEQVMDAFLKTSELPPELLRGGLRRMALASKCVPILCGSSFRNKGVQPLLDAVVDYLPSPLDRPPAIAVDVKGNKREVHPRSSTPQGEDPFCALAFKVVHHHQKGHLVYFRVYSGTATPGMTLHNSTLDTKERVSKILSISGEDMEEIREVTVGNIGAAVGLKETRTGDTLISQDKKLPPIQLTGIKVPPPVFVCSVEATSPSAQKALDSALASLHREDPSFTLTTDEETGQTLLSGMGELHLEILQHRLLNHYRVPIEIGRIRISYRGTISIPASGKIKRSYEIAGRQQTLELALQLKPLPRGTGNIVEDTLPEKSVSAEVRAALQRGLHAACARGIFLGYPLEDVHITAHELVAPLEVTAGVVTACAVEALREVAQGAEPKLLEPQMKVSFQVDHRYVGDVVADVSGARRGTIESVEMGVTTTNILAEVPLKELIGYSTCFRSITSGNGTFSMEYSRYKDMSAQEHKKLLDSIRGVSY